MPTIDPDNFRDMDEPVNIEGLAPDEALALLLAVDPAADPTDDD